MADGKVVYEVTADSSSYNSTITQAQATAKNAAAAITAAFAAVGVAAGSFFKASVDSGSEFYATMSDVRAISGATGSDFESLTTTAKDLGASTVFSANEAAQALTYMGMAGWDTQAMLSGISGVMDLAAASGEDLAMVSDIVTDALTAFGMTAEDTQRFVDVLAAAATSSNTNVSLMGETFKYVAPLCGTLGYSAEDAAIAIGLMANSGIKGSQAGTALKTALANMAAPTDKMAKAMNELGISLTDSSGNMLSLMDVLLNLRSAFDGMDAAQQTAYASTIFGKEAMSGMLAIVNAADEDFDKLTTAIYNSAGAASKMAEIRLDNLAGDVEALSGAFDGIKLTTFDQMNGGLRKIVQALTGAVDSANEAIEANDELQLSFDKIGDSVSDFIDNNLSRLITEGLPALADGILWIIDHGDGIITVISGIGAAIAVIQGMKIVSGIAAIVASLNPVTIAIGAVTAAIAMFATNMQLSNKDVKEAQQEMKALSDELESNAQSAQASAKAYNELISAMEKQYAKARDLAKSIMELSKKEEKAASDKAKLVSLCQQLNDLVPGLGLAYDSVTDSLNMSADAMEAFIGSAEKQETLNANTERYTQLLEEQATKLATMKSIDAERQEKLKELIALQEQAANGEMVGYDINLVKGQIDILNEKFKEAGVAYRDASQDLHNFEASLNAAAASAEDAEGKLAAVADAAKNFGDLGGYVSMFGEEATAALNGIGITAEDVQNGLESFASYTQNMFQDLSETTSISVEEMISNLTKNQEMISQWSADLESLSGRIGDELLNALRDAGPEYAATVEGLVGATDEQLAALEAAFSAGGEAAVQAFLAQFGIELEESPGAKLMEDAAKGIENSTAMEDAGKSQVNKAKTAMSKEVEAQSFNEVGEQIDSATASGINESTESESAIQAQIGDVKSTASEEVDAQDFNSVGLSIADGIAAGIDEGTPAIEAAARAAASAALRAAQAQLDINSPSKKFRDLIGANSMFGWANGIYDNMDLVIDAIEKCSSSTLLSAEKGAKAFYSLFDAAENFDYSDDYMSTEKMQKIAIGLYMEEGKNYSASDLRKIKNSVASVNDIVSDSFAAAFEDVYDKNGQANMADLRRVQRQYDSVMSALMPAEASGLKSYLEDNAGSSNNYFIEVSGNVEMDGYKVGEIVLQNFDDVASGSLRG